MKTQAETLSFFFGQTWWVIQHMTEGLTHADSLLLPAAGGNCLNWVLGHLVTERDEALGWLGQAPLWTEAETQIYQRRSEPLVEAAQALPLERILGDLAQTQEQMLARLATVTPEELAAPSGESTVGERLTFMLWHETYHVGQLELLRHLAGKHEQVI